MSNWIARYEEGYVSPEGIRVSLGAQLYEQHPWATPEEALAHWRKRPDLAGPDVRKAGNGLEQEVSVASRPDFAAVGAVAIWRRVTFEPRHVVLENTEAADGAAAYTQAQ